MRYFSLFALNYVRLVPLFLYNKFSIVLGKCSEFHIHKHKTIVDSNKEPIRYTWWYLFFFAWIASSSNKKNWSRSFFPRQSELTGKMTLTKLIIQNSLRFTICFFFLFFCFNVHICVIHCLCLSFHCFFPIRFLSIGKTVDS